MSNHPASPPPVYSNVDGAAGGAYPPPPPPAYQGPPKGYSGGPQYYSYQNGPPMGAGQPNQPSYPAQPYPNTTVVMTQPQLTMVQVYRQSPVRCFCPHCRADVMTATHYETGALTWILCLVIFFLGFVFGCCLIPFCIDETKDVVHTCPNCNQVIAHYNRL